MSFLRVGQVTLSMGQGGIESLIVSLVRQAAGSRTRYHLYCLDEGGELLEDAALAGVPVSVFQRRPGMDWSLVWRLSRAFKRDRLQVVHTHNQAAHFYGCLAARLARVPVVVTTEHSRHYIDGHWRRRVEKRLLCAWSDRVVPVSDELERLCVERDQIVPAKLCVIGNGVDTALFDRVTPGEVAEFRQRQKISPGDPVLGIVARLHPIKNHPLLLHAFGELLRDFPAARLLVVGDGEQRGALESLTAALGMQQRVSFLGSRRDVPVILKACDLKVLCSLSEGLPLSLLEAMAAQLPVVVTPGANRSALVEDGINGMVVPETAAALADALGTLLSSPQRAGELGRAGYRAVRERFSLSTTARRYARLYSECLGAGPSIFPGEAP